MSNELKEIADRLNGICDDGWQITQAARRVDGSWDLVIQPIEKEAKAEANDDNN